MADKYKILVIDDEADFRQLLQMRLGKKFEVTATDSAQKAFELLKEYQPDLIVTDIVMPGISGLSFLSSVEKRNIPTIVMSGLALDALETAKEFAADDVIAKPFKIGDLEAKIENILGQTKILITIESDIERKALHRLLVESKHKVYSAFGEKHLLDMIVKRKINLILLEMRDPSYVDLIAKIKKASLAKTIAVVGISPDEERKAKATAEGFDAVIVKPLSRENIAATVEPLLGSRGG